MACTLILLVSLSSHAIDRGAIAVIVYFIHEVAAALWIGANPRPVVWRRARRAWLRLGAANRAASLERGGMDRHDTDSERPLYSLLFAWCDPHRLIDAAYGRTLVDKICAAMLVLLIGAYNRCWVMPAVSESSAQASLLRNVGIESILLIGVLGLAALPRQYPAGALTTAARRGAL